MRRREVLPQLDKVKMATASCVHIAAVAETSQHLRRSRTVDSSLPRQRMTVGQSMWRYLPCHREIRDLVCVCTCRSAGPFGGDLTASGHQGSLTRRSGDEGHDAATREYEILRTFRAW